jgi:hypothetical protein
MLEVRVGEKQPASRPQEPPEVADELGVVSDVLGYLEADDLVELTELACELVELAQVRNLEMNPLDTQGRGTALGGRDLVWRERQPQHLVAESGCVYREAAVARTRVESARARPAKPPPQPEPAVRHARIAVEDQRPPPEQAYQEIADRWNVT